MHTVKSLQTGGISLQTVQENFIAYFRIFAGLPDITFVEEDTAAWITSVGVAPGNQVLKTNFTQDLAAEQIDETLRRIGRYVNAVDWMIWPGDQPDNLGPLLAERGAAGGPGGEWVLYGNIGKQPGTWLVIDLTALPEHVSVADDFHVEQVTNVTQLDTWVEINAKGFGNNDYSVFRAAYLRHGFGDDAQAIHFIGYQGGQPVTSSTLLIAGGSASAYDISTPIDLRGRGLGSAITHATLQAARERGYQTSWIWSSPMGRSVYQKLGFVITDFGIREYQWKKRIGNTNHRLRTGLNMTRLPQRNESQC